MLEILKFVLSDFWVFCGTVILIYVSGMSVSMIAAAAFGNDTGYSLINIGGKKKEESKEEKDGAV